MGQYIVLNVPAAGTAEYRRIQGIAAARLHQQFTAAGVTGVTTDMLAAGCR